MIHIKAPNRVPPRGPTSVFLAGAIDQGRAIDWQSDVVSNLSDLNVTVLNPRRDNWDPTWDQSPDNPQFAEQVAWEYYGMEQSEYQFYAFPKDSKAPISFYEFGRFARSRSSVVWLEPGFYRSGNVKLYCQYNRIACFDMFEIAVSHLKYTILGDKYYKMFFSPKGL